MWSIASAVRGEFSVYAGTAPPPASGSDRSARARLLVATRRGPARCLRRRELLGVWCLLHQAPGRAGRIRRRAVGDGAATAGLGAACDRLFFRARRARRAARPRLRGFGPPRKASVRASTAAVEPRARLALRLELAPSSGRAHLARNAVARITCALFGLAHSLPAPRRFMGSACSWDSPAHRYWLAAGGSQLFRGTLCPDLASIRTAQVP
jgi:hypothetical protein